MAKILFETREAAEKGIDIMRHSVLSSNISQIYKREMLSFLDEYATRLKYVILI